MNIEKSLIADNNKEKNNLVVFSAIINFVKDLTSVFKKNTHKPLYLYQHLLSKTQKTNTLIVDKHIKAFRDFCEKNRDSIEKKSVELLKEDCIIYSHNVFINIKFLFNNCDIDTDIKNSIWKHLIYLSSLLDHKGKAKEMLRNAFGSGNRNGNVNTDEKSNDKENELLNKIIQSIDTCNISTDNPLEAVQQIMASDVCKNLFADNSATEGLDPQKLIRMIKGLVSKLENKLGSDPEEQQSFSLIRNVVSMLDGIQQGEQPDISQLQGLLSGVDLSSILGGNAQISPDMMGFLYSSVSDQFTNQSSNQNTQELFSQIMNSIPNTNLPAIEENKDTDEENNE